MATRSSKPVPPTVAPFERARQADQAQKTAGAPRAARAGTEVEYAVYVEAFNRDLKTLTRDVVERYPEDATIYRAEKRVMLAINADPLFVINSVGQYLFAYRDQIYALESGGMDAERFFLDSSYDSEIREGVNKEKIDLVNYIMPKMKECVLGLDGDEKAAYKRLVVSLLDNYIEYLTAKLKK